MKFLVPAFIIGFIVNIFIFPQEYGAEVLPLWTGSIKSMDTVETAAEKDAGSRIFSLWTPESITFIDGNGKVKAVQNADTSLTVLSGNDQFFARYEKLGKSIELLNWKGERFWKMASREYPFLSYNGKLILLLVADHSRVRIMDYNGSEIGKKEIAGRFCTALSFSERGDNGAVGFMDGTYHFINNKGVVMYEGRVSLGSVVKGVAVSPGGFYGAVHYGNKNKDQVDIIDIAGKDIATMPLGSVHLTKTGMNVTDKGYVTIIDDKAIINADSDGDERFRITIKAARIGYSSVIHDKSLYAVAYSSQSGEGVFYLFNEEGEVLMNKEYPAETFLHPLMRDGLILLRGSDNLYCYNILSLPEE